MPGLLEDNGTTEVAWSHGVNAPGCGLVQSRELSLGNSNQRVYGCPLHCSTCSAYIIYHSSTCCIVEWVEAPHERTLIRTGDRTMTVVQRLMSFGHHQSCFLQIKRGSGRESIAPPSAQEDDVVELYERSWIK